MPIRFELRRGCASPTGRWLLRAHIRPGAAPPVPAPCASNACGATNPPTLALTRRKPFLRYPPQLPSPFGIPHNSPPPPVSQTARRCPSAPAGRWRTRRRHRRSRRPQTCGCCGAHCLPFTRCILTGTHAFTPALLLHSHLQHLHPHLPLSLPLGALGRPPTSARQRLRSHLHAHRMISSWHSHPSAPTPPPGMPRQLTTTLLH